MEEEQGVQRQADGIPDLYRDKILERDQEFKALKAIMANYEETYGFGQETRKNKDFIAAGLLERFGNEHNRNVRIIKDAGEDNMSRHFSLG